MKKQICFAGVTGPELEALQSALAELGEAWNCVFCTDGESTLEALAGRPFDAVVTNQRLNGMNGAVLLHLAANRFPQTLRFVLGNMADQQLVINSIGATHQFISSPWEAEDIIAIIHRSLALDTLLANDKLRSFVPRLGKMPGVPATYFEILKEVESPNVSTDSIGEIIARDPALTARLLQMANSPACGLSQKVTSPLEAVSILGLDTIKSLVLCLQVFRQTPSGETPSMSLDSLWRRSFIVGNLAGKIARHQAGDARMASDAFTAGLLHKVGQIILATNLSREYRAVVAAACEKKRPLQEEELAQLGVTSDQVGAYLLGLWGLPLALVEAVGLHYAPAQCGTREFSLLTAVHVAVALADEEHGGEGGLPPAQLDVEYLASLGLPTKPGAWHKALAHEEPAHISRETPQEQCTAPETVPALPLGRLFAVAAVVVSAVIILANRPVSAPRSPPAPAKTVEPLAAKPAPSAQKDGFDSLVLQRIIYHANRSLVIINGRTLGLGETVNGAEILSIEPSSVTLALSGEQKTFTLK
jgi:HD-like signal output (HDOD) protein/CheY-like chemotaxis protein